MVQETQHLANSKPKPASSIEPSGPANSLGPEVHSGSMELRGADTASEASASLVERLAHSLFVVLVGLLVLLLAIAGAATRDSHQTWSAILFGLASSALSAIVLSVLYRWIVERFYVRALSRSLSANINQAIEGIKSAHDASLERVTGESLDRLEELEKSYFHQIARQFPQLIPSDYFPPSDVPDPRFNRALHKSLEESRIYLCKMVTARHVPFRLESVKNRRLDCRILVADPRLDDLLWISARNRWDLRSRSLSKIQAVSLLRQEIYSTIVVLFDAASFYPIEIGVHQGSVSNRMEILDNDAYVSYPAAGLATPYPVTFLYRKGGFHYDAFIAEFYESYELCTTFGRFSLGSEDAALLEFLSDLGYRGDLASIRRSARDLKSAVDQRLRATLSV